MERRKREKALSRLSR